MLKVTNLHKWFATPEGRNHVVDGINFEIAEGRCTVLLGPSGCGKTTVLRCVAGLEQTDGGVIEIGGTVVADAARGIDVPVHERPIGMVFQSYAIWPHLNVFENVAYPLRVERPRLRAAEITSRVTEVLTMVGMRALAERPSARLSGGQQQRVALARALVRRPKLLLLDEPLSNLDARLRDTMRNELSELIARAGVTALFVTHDQAEAFAIADTVAILHGGRVVQEGPPREVYGRPRSPFIAAFLGDANVLAGTVEAIGDAGLRHAVLSVAGGVHRVPLMIDAAPGSALDLVIRPEDLRLHVNPPHESANALAGTVARIGFLGGLNEYGVDVGGIQLKVLSRPFDALAVGSAVWLEAPAERWAVFRRAE